MTRPARRTLATIGTWLALYSSGGCAALVGADFDDKTLGEGGGVTASGAGPGTGSTSSGAGSTSSVTGPGPTSSSTGDGGGPSSTSTGDGGAPVSAGSMGDGGANEGGGGGGACGRAAWAVDGGTAKKDTGPSVAVAPCGEVFFSSRDESSSGDVFVRKLSPTGSTLWTFDTPFPYRQLVDAIALDPDGNLVVVGRSNAPMNPGGACPSLEPKADGDDVFVLKLDGSTKACIWAGMFGAPDTDEAPKAVAVDPITGRIFVAGDFETPMDFGGQSLAASGPSTFFVSFTDLGTPDWAYGYAGGEVRGLATNGQEVFMSGTFTGTFVIDGDSLGTAAAGDEYAFAAGFDVDDGSRKWGEGFGAAGASVRFNQVAVDGTASAVFSGSVKGLVNFGDGAVATLADDVVIVELSAIAGVHMWSTVVVESGDQRARGAAVDGAGNLVVSGVFEQDLTFGDLDPIMAQTPEDDIFAVGFSPARMPMWSTRFDVSVTDTPSTGENTRNGIAATTGDVVTVFTASVAQVKDTLLSNTNDQTIVVKQHPDGSF